MGGKDKACRFRSSALFLDNHDNGDQSKGCNEQARLSMY